MNLVQRNRKFVIIILLASVLFVLFSGCVQQKGQDNNAKSIGSSEKVEYITIHDLEYKGGVWYGELILGVKAVPGSTVPITCAAIYDGEIDFGNKSAFEGTPDNCSYENTPSRNCVYGFDWTPSIPEQHSKFGVCCDTVAIDEFKENDNIRCKEMSTEGIKRAKNIFKDDLVTKKDIENIGYTGTIEVKPTIMTSEARFYTRITDEESIKEVTVFGKLETLNYSYEVRLNAARKDTLRYKNVTETDEFGDKSFTAYDGPYYLIVFRKTDIVYDVYGPKEDKDKIINLVKLVEQKVNK